MADDMKDKFAREDKELATAGIRPLKLEMFPYPMAEIRERIDKFWGSHYWQRRIPSGFKMHMLELEKMFRKAATQAQCNLACERRRTNLAYRLREVLRFLRSKKMLVNSVDKNLGSALISRSRSNEQNRLHILGPVRPPERQGPEVQELRLDQDNVAYVGISKTREEIFEDIYMELRDILTQFHAAVSGAKSLFDRFLRYVQDCQKHGSLCSAYVIFKVHKPPNAMGIQSRPIAAQRAYPTRVVSQFLHDQFCELVMKHPHVLKDTKDLVRLLARGKPNSQGNILETGDVVALYPSIPHDLGLRALEWFMQTQFEDNAKHLIPWLLRLTKFVLENNFVECKDIHEAFTIFKQVIGTAMGTIFSVMYANVVMIFLETPVVTKFINQLTVYKRLLDDIIINWIGDTESLLQFKKEMNEANSAIKIEWNGGNDYFDRNKHKQVNYLDLSIWIEYDERGVRAPSFVHRTFAKKGNAYAFVPYKSYHCRHVFSGWVKGYIIRLLVNSSKVEFWNQDCQDFAVRLSARGYPRAAIQTVLQGVFWDERDHRLFKAKEDKASLFYQQHKGCVLTVTQSPNSDLFLKYLDLSLKDLRQTVKGQRIFAAKLFVAKANSPNLGRIFGKK